MENEEYKNSKIEFFSESEQTNSSKQIDKQKRLLIKKSIVASLIGTAIFVFYEIYITITSKSSTAAIAFVILPFLAIFVFLILFILISAILHLFSIRKTHKEGEKIGKKKFVQAIIAIIVILIFFSSTFYFIRRNIYINESLTTSNRNEISKMYVAALAKRDVEVLSRIAKNPATPENIMNNLYDYALENNSENNKYTICFPVARGLATNKSASSNLLDKLSDNNFPSDIHIMVAGHRNTSVETLVKLLKDNEELVRNRAIRNPNLPTENLKEIVKSTNSQDRETALAMLYYRGVISREEWYRLGGK
jgi:hypothetical protein